MGNYQYVARSAAGERIAGVMQADSQLAVVRTLEERKLFPVSISEQAANGSHLGSRRLKMRDVGVMYGQLADLLRSGVPLLRAMEVLAKAGIGPSLKEVVLKVRDDVAAGRTLADAMAQHRKAFPPLHCAMVRAGEQAGFLEDVLTNLAEFLERQDELRSKVRGALIYPAVLVGLGTVMMTFVLTVLVPKFSEFFANIDKPLPTRVLFAASDLLREHMALVVALVVLAVLGIRSLLRSQAGRNAWDRWRLRIPVMGGAMKMVSITRFCRILGTMLHNGVPILQALAISKDAAGCTILQMSIEDATDNVRAGEPLAEPLRQSRLFPAEIVEMIAVAEESNQLEKVLMQVADTVERRTARQVDQAVRLIEPLILVVIAGAMLFVAVGLLYPIFNLGQMLR